MKTNLLIWPSSSTGMAIKKVLLAIGPWKDISMIQKPVVSSDSTIDCLLIFPSTSATLNYYDVWSIVASASGKLYVIEGKDLIRLVDIFQMFYKKDLQQWNLATLLLLVRVFHDVFKNTYLIEGSSGISRLKGEYPHWFRLWKAAGGYIEKDLTEKLVKLEEYLDNYSGEKRARRLLIKRIGRIYGGLESKIARKKGG